MDIGVLAARATDRPGVYDISGLPAGRIRFFDIATGQYKRANIFMRPDVVWVSSIVPLGELLNQFRLVMTPGQQSNFVGTLNMLIQRVIDHPQILVAGRHLQFSLQYMPEDDAHVHSLWGIVINAVGDRIHKNWYPVPVFCNDPTMEQEGKKLQLFLPIVEREGKLFLVGDTLPILAIAAE